MGTLSDFASKPDPEKTEWQEKPTSENASDKPTVPEPFDPSDLPKSADDNNAGPEASTAEAPKQEESGLKLGGGPTQTKGPNADEIAARLFAMVKPLGTKSPLKMMIMGPPGATKSSFAATAEDALVVDFEEGMISAKFSPNGIGKGTVSIPYTNFDEFQNLIALIKNNHPQFEQFKTIVIDTISDLQKQSLSEVVERDWKKAPNTKNRYVPETEHYVEVNEKILRIVRALRDCDRNVLVITHSKTVEPKNQPAKTYADFSESLSNKLSAMMSIVGYMELTEQDKKPVPIMQVVPDNNGVQVKTRISLPERIANPTFPKILAKWEEATKDE